MFKLLCYLLLSVSAFSETRAIHSLSEISIDEWTEKTLVLFDLDDVLIYPKDALLQHWRNEWRPEGMRAWAAEEDTIAWLSATFQILDPLGPKLLDRLHQKNIPAIGFTAFAMDQVELHSIPEWRSQHLKELGLNFKVNGEVTFPVQAGFVPPSFKYGVLYCGDFYKKDPNNKGKVLSLYLNWLDWRPKRVVLIDDSKKNIESVERELDRREIPFLGFHYIPKELDPLDETVAELQYRTLINQKRWLSDKAAKNGSEEDD